MQLASIGAAFHARSGLKLGASDQRRCRRRRSAEPTLQPGEIAIAVVGAHLSGMPLNRELRALNARLLNVTTTAADYKLFALRGTVPPKPGLLRVERGSGSAHHAGGLGTDRGSVRKVREQHPLADGDRHAAAR